MTPRRPASLASGPTVTWPRCSRYPPPDIAALVREINAKRRAAYEDIAKQNVPIDQVGAVTAEKIKAQAPPGQYFLAPDGSWVQK